MRLWLNVYIHVKGDGYFQFAPGHNMPEHLCYKLRQHADEWEAVALGSPDGLWSSKKEGDVVMRLLLKDGALYESWSGSTNWTLHARIYFPLHVWTAKLLKE
jgi:hypothetical protein